MISKICNTGNEHHIDVFYKIAIFEKNGVANFSHFMDDDDIYQIFETIPDTAQVLMTDLLPQNLNFKNSTKITKSGILHNVAIDFLITPQDKKLQDLLETYQNKEMVVLLSKTNTTHVVGTTINPLLFVYEPVNDNKPNALKGYKIKLKGSTLGPERIFDHINFTVYNRGLAFTLPQNL